MSCNKKIIAENEIAINSAPFYLSNIRDENDGIVSAVVDILQHSNTSHVAHSWS